MQIEHRFFLWEWKRLANQTTNALAQGVVESLNVSGFSGFLADQLMCCRRDTVISAPAIAETATTQIFVGQFAPQATARIHRTVADKEGENLPRPPTLDDPDALVLRFALYEGEKFVGFQCLRSGLHWSHRRFKSRQRLGFFWASWVPCDDWFEKSVRWSANCYVPDTSARRVLDARHCTFHWAARLWCCHSPCTCTVDFQLAFYHLKWAWNFHNPDRFW